MILNPLSFSQNVHQDIAVLVRDALSKLGVDGELMSNFDSHSAIQIELNDSVPINISLHNDRLLIWSLLSTNEELLVTNARALLSAITTPIEGVEGGGCVLLNIDQSHELRAIVNLDALKNDQLNHIVLQFHQLLALINF